MTALAACPFCGTPYDGILIVLPITYLEGWADPWKAELLSRPRSICRGCAAVGPPSVAPVETWNQRATARESRIVQDGEHTVARLNAEGVAE